MRGVLAHPRSDGDEMVAYTDDGVAVEWHSSSIPPEQLDAAIRRDRNLIIRYGEQLLATR